MIESIATDAPVFLVIDDAHWADASSLGLLASPRATIIPTAAVLVVVTYRDTDVDRAHPLAAMIGDFRREPRVERMFAARYRRGWHASAAGGRRWCTSSTSSGERSRTRWCEETEGNPFFVGEVIRHLIETNVIVHRDGQWQGTVTSIDEVGIPEGVRDVVGRRLSRLSDDANATLRTAAVVGREFPVDLVAEVEGVPENAVLEHVEAAIAARLVDEVAGAHGRMSFSHALVRSTLLDELSTTRRVRLHRQVGEALERRGDASAAELAHHFSEAAATGVAGKALEHAVRAAEEAHARVAYDEVVHFYDLALEALDAGEGDEVTRATLLIERGYAQHERNDVDAGRADALAAAGFARRVGHAGLVGRAGVTYQGLVGHWAAPHDPVAVELMREGLAGLGEGDDLDRARVTAALANALVLAPGDEALVLSEEAERLAKDVGDDQARYMALSGWAWALRSRGRSADLIRVASTNVQHGDAVGRPDWEYTACYLLGEGLIESGELDAAVEEFERAAAFPGVLHGWAPVVYAASRALSAGRLDEAEELIERAAPLGAALGETNDVIVWTQQLTLAMARAQYDDARAWMDRLDQTVFGVAGGWRMLMLAEAAISRRPRRRMPPGRATSAHWCPRSSRPGCSKRRRRLPTASATLRSPPACGTTSLHTPGTCSVATPRSSGSATTSSGVSRSSRVATTTQSLRPRARSRWRPDGGSTGSSRTTASTSPGRSSPANGPGDAERARATLTEALATAEQLGLVAATAEIRTLR